MSEWQTGAPPNEKVVEVEYEGDVIRVRAMWGRDGMLPHWESEDRNCLWEPRAFSRWRAVAEEHELSKDAPSASVAHSAPK